MSVMAKNSSSNTIKKSPRITNAKASAALIAAKQEARRIKESIKRNSSSVVRDIYQKAIDAKEMIRKESGVVYEHTMLEHKCLWDPNYPECPERLSSILERCKQLGLLERCKFIEPQEVEQNQLLLKHTPAHIEILKSTENCNDTEKLEELSSKYDAIYFHPTTYRLSLLATGSAINLVENICNGNIQNGMAIIRPPGHHAMKAEYCGYCFFNNVAIAAEVALKNNLAKKILIVDWDVHHGQATQQMYYNDSRVVYFSIHRYEQGEFWPNLRESDYHYIGEGAGEGFNFNIPLNQTGMTNADYIAIFHHVLLPMANEFQPDLIIVSAGYDAALGCPEGLMRITPACYSHLLSMLLGFACGKVAVILEGGYCLKSLAEGAALTLKTLLGDPCPLLEPLKPPCKSVQETILNVIYAHKLHWKCFQFQDTYSTNDPNSQNKQVKHLPTVSFKGPDDPYSEVYETRNCYPVQSNEELKKIHIELDNLIQNTKLSKASNKVCIVYDERMLAHYNVADETHPEKPSRISSIFSKHKDYGLIQRCLLLKGRIASNEEILLAHTQEYLNRIKKTHEKGLRDLEKQASDLNSVYLHPETWNSSRVAAGSLLEVVDNVLKGESQRGVAIVRPPGHHAEKDAACGFCIFNNIAIAAKYAVTTHKLKRVLIVDWDVHHGNGTQSITEKDPKILYISLHRYDNGNFFPRSKDANYNFVGSGAGEGFTVNIPWNKKGMGDVEYATAFHQLIMPIAYHFDPELVLVSAGFDACIGDPLGGCKVSPEMYGHMTHWLSSLANGRIVLSLEGGYNVNSISHAMTMCTKALLGDPLPALEPAREACCISAAQSIRAAATALKPYWKEVLAIPTTAIPREDGILPRAKVPRPKPTQRLITPLSNNALESVEQALKHLTVNCAPDPRASGSGTKDEEPGPSSSDSGPGTAAGGGGERPVGRLDDFLREHLQALADERMFAVVPRSDCPHLRHGVAPLPETPLDCRLPCRECDSTLENWLCLSCYTVHCARSINQHALEHERTARHPIALSFSDLSVWCYGCEAYLDNPVLYAARNAVHKSKFNTELPWTYDSPRPDDAAA